MKSFELWLDESGDFCDVRGSSKPTSLIGGVLMDRKTALAEEWKAILSREHYDHATEMKKEEKADYVLPAMEQLIRDYRAQPVYFENKEREGHGDNRELYLRIMAEGILQLLQKLDATYGGVELDIVIATRVAQSQNKAEYKHIKDTEYLNSLRAAIKMKEQKKGILLSKGTSFHLAFKRAQESKRLIFADFFCNARFAYHSNNSYYKENMQRIRKLFKKALLFSLLENPLQNRISQMSSRNDLADALMEIFMVIPPIDRDEYVEMLINRMQLLSYRSLKYQMRHASGEITVYASQQESYEAGILFLQGIRQGFLVKAKEQKIPLDYFEFNLLLQLSDMCLRSGKLVLAMQVLSDCRKVQKNLGNYLKEALSYHQLLEKEAVFAIDAFNYRLAAGQMEKVCRGFEEVMASFQRTEIAKERFSDMQSEYYGDALCMWIYALIFEFKNKDEKQYRQLVELSDIALKQYPAVEGELERHRQYRSRIECKYGKYKVALHWLIQSCIYHHWNEEEEISPRLLHQFFDKIYREGEPISAQYYMMYYVLIMEAAWEEMPEFAEMMYQSLMEQKELLHLTKLKRQENKLDKDIDSVRWDKDHQLYHPMEIVLWKLAEYALKKAISSKKKIAGTTDITEQNRLEREQKIYLDMANDYYDRAVKVCGNSPDNLNLRIIGLVIWACRFSVWSARKERFNDYYQKLCQESQAVKSEVQRLAKEFQSLNLNSVEMTENIKCTEALVSQISQKISACQDTNNKVDSRQLAELKDLVDY